MVKQVVEQGDTMKLWGLILRSRRGSKTGVQREGDLMPPVLVELRCHCRKENGITNSK